MRTAALSLAFTYLFFFEYLPPARSVRIPYDLEGYHYPLADYAFQAVRHGRFPEWDPTIYCGLSFPANIQAALFYPPTWIMFAANFGRPGLSYQSLEDLAIMHVSLAFLLCYLWLRHKNLSGLAGVFGAGVFAYSGYMLNQLQHFGLVAGWSWIPLALWGIDEAAEQQHWRPMWKVILASAMCFLAGYPPTWVVFAVCAMSYAAGRWKTAIGVLLALGASLLLAAVQLLPAREAAAMKIFDPRYGTGWRNPEAYIAYLVPNYFGFELHHTPIGWGGDYLYLGVPGLLGLLLLARLKTWRPLLPLLSVLVASVVMATNPFNLVWNTIQHSDLLAQICRDWYFLAGLTLAAAALAAFGLDHWLSQAGRPMPRWMVLLSITLLTVWSARQLFVWFRGSAFPSGWRSAVDAAITLALFSIAFLILPGQKGRLRTILVTSLLLAVAVDYKVYGTSKWFDASEGRLAMKFNSVPGLDDRLYRKLAVDPEHRIFLDPAAPDALKLRHYGLTTPQGFDPLLPARYKKLIISIGRFDSDYIDIDPNKEAALGLLGVRYFITYEGAPLYSRLSANSNFRLLEPSTSYYKVFEYVRAQPAYGWVQDRAGQSIQLIRWAPEHREFLANSESGGQFALKEQFLPGWQATLDGSPIPIEQWSDAFQAIQVPSGQHRIVFRFRSLSLRFGAIITLLEAIGIIVIFRNSPT